LNDPEMPVVSDAPILAAVHMIKLTKEREIMLTFGSTPTTTSGDRTALEQSDAQIQTVACEDQRNQHEFRKIQQPFSAFRYRARLPGTHLRELSLL
jgi:hypothetical protein